MRVGIIGGTGLYRMEAQEEEPVRVATPFGPVVLRRVLWAEREVFFVARHGEQHHIPPHRVNYRANVWALKEVGVERVLSSSAVGSLRPEMRPGDLALVDQFLDFTRGRVTSFYQGDASGVFHVDVTDPYCPELRATLAASAARIFPAGEGDGGEGGAGGRDPHEAGQHPGPVMHPAATYVCAEGPRYETAAEIRAFRQLGGDLVGMTNVPEVVLAREAGLCYATVAVVTNLAAGLASAPLTHQEVTEVMESASERLRALLQEAVRRLEPPTCACAELGGPWPPDVERAGR
ncbi:MTAP family purine nucleoside phosphorylase [Limnochorda pilosa]|uniref:Probable 6-oxopurine nucleoside phosphorylase n=1 Tax=Limnochorda pilosa TaxID=1555112 RepID=A0A0K2SJU2_LIMPI|nr:MTAP family purine nucleoside phosphorylase [Limnochorda pilosa]BAS27277.1 5'-methylthioadenosine phosphorylase [Limnochorda pilosa]